MKIFVVFCWSLKNCESKKLIKISIFFYIKEKQNEGKNIPIKKILHEWLIVLAVS